MLLTNDNRLGDLLTNPDSKIPKTYEVRLNKPLSVQDRNLFEAGIVVNGQRLKPAKVRLLKNVEGHRIELTIIEGKNRQIRRMCNARGYEVIELIRTRLGSYELGDLEIGRWKFLSREEVRRLLVVGSG